MNDVYACAMPKPPKSAPGNGPNGMKGVRRRQGRARVKREEPPRSVAQTATEALARAPDVGVGSLYYVLGAHASAKRVQELQEQLHGTARAER
eukprot:6214688-Pleurochrysis_carterae.AAC.1